MIVQNLIISLSRKRNTPSHNWKNQLLTALLILVSSLALAQGSIEEHKDDRRIGVNLGYSQQDRFPFNQADYSHITRYVKIQLAQEIWKKDKSGLEVLIEPSVYFVNHQLLNFFFIKPSEPNFEEQRAIFTQNRSYEEYAVNLGLVYNYNLIEDLKIYGLISVGPMTATADTERQRKGFSFSDILGAGARYSLKDIHFDLRFTLRHVSNAQLRSPNNGHNSAGIEVGISYSL